MRWKLIILLFVIIVGPMSLLTWAGLRLARDEQTMARQRLSLLMAERLEDIDRSLVAHWDAIRIQMQNLTDLDTFDAASIRQRIRDEPRVQQLFVIAPDGTLLHPDPAGSLNRSEREFLVAATQIITDRELQRATGLDSDDSNQSAHQRESQSDDISRRGQVNRPISHSAEQAGWFVWYWGRGLNLIYWQRRESGHIIGVALDRARWIADLIAALPDTAEPVSSAHGRSAESQIRLIDSTSRPVYQWGGYEVPDGAAPLCEVPLSTPLSSWTLQQFVPQEFVASPAGRGTHFNFVAGLAAVALGLTGVAFYFFREYSRDMREAAHRVSFVNQVSHELRTPLTNIRMYAELLETDLDSLSKEVAEQPRKRLQVILSESQRLSRLIGNVLTFARQQRSTLCLNPQPACVDELVQNVLDRFCPTWDEHQIQVAFQAGAPDRVLVDADAVEQILENLFSNVEKYAAEGGSMTVTTRGGDGRTTITVADHGPGIEPSLRNEIFEPFRRGSVSLDRAAGTGIGLTIARELARLQGGDITLVPSARGACFQVELETLLADKVSRDESSSGGR